MKDKLIELVNTKPRHYTRMIQKDEELLKFVNGFQGDTLSEKTFNAIYGNQITKCPENNEYKFKSVIDGYKFCKLACQCQKNQVSKKLKGKKKPKDHAAKIKQTNLKRYGVDNVGKLQKSIDAHKEFYSDKNKVDGIIHQIKQTKKDRYGDENYSNIEQRKKTWNKKYSNKKYWSSRFPNINYDILHNKEKMKELYENKSLEEIMKMVNCKWPDLIRRYQTEYGFRTKFKSAPEKEIELYLQEININNIIRNTRKIIGKELDFYLPDYNLAIEYNGIYWHHEDIPHITKNYHYDKFIKCEKLGIQLITIFSNNWSNNKDIVKESLKVKFGISDSIYARNTTVKKITSKDTKDILNQNHIQGYVPSQICYGLYNDNDLVAVMTFSRPRSGIGKNQEGYELVRYVSNKRVVGGASKLLRQFRIDYPSESIYSYSNNEWSNGNLYKAIGFTIEKEVGPGYWYVHPKEEKLLHRYNFAKHLLIERGENPDLTEVEICKKNGLLRVWDCGKRKWILK